MKEIYEAPYADVIEMMTEQAVFSSSTEENSNSPYWEHGYDF